MRNGRYDVKYYIGAPSIPVQTTIKSLSEVSAILLRTMNATRIQRIKKIEQEEGDFLQKLTAQGTFFWGGLGVRLTENGRQKINSRRTRSNS